MSEEMKPGAGGLLIVERATTGSGEFIGLRLTLPESDKITLVFADQKAMPGFRYGKEFIPDFGETVRYADELSQLREELAQRDAEIEGLNAELDHVRSGRSELQSRVNALASQQAASVGGEREAFEAWAASVGYHTERDMFQREKYQSTLTWELWRAWQARAALSPAGGGAGQDVPDVVRQFVESQAVCSDCHLDEACCRPLLRAAKEAFAAAPQPPARHDQGDEVRRLREALEAIQSRASNLMDDELFDMCDAALTQSPKGEEE